MKKIFVVGFLMLLITVSGSKAAGMLRTPYVPGEVLIGWFEQDDLDSVESIVADWDSTIIETSLSGANFARVTVPKGYSVEEFVSELQGDSRLRYIEPNYYRYASLVPNDPYYTYQWNLPKINCPAAWNVVTGAGVIVAVVDTGVSTAGSDRFGHYQAGWDYVDNDSNPTDLNGHGTHVAGTIGQATNNSVGVAGVAYNCTVMGVRVLDAQGSGTVANVANGIRYAADHGAKVINLSLGATSGSTTEEDAVNYAYGRGCIICAAAGNEGAASGVDYPARYANCIAVGASRYDNAVCSYSNRGTGLDVVAPGGDTNVDQNGDGYPDGILQETFSGSSWGYYFFAGTSMATPHVCGVAALVWSAHPAYTNAQVRSAIETTATDLGAAGWDSSYGWGLVNAAAAVGSSGNPTPTHTPPAATPTPTRTPTRTPTPSGCTVTITYNYWFASQRQLTVKATCSSLSTLTLYTDGVNRGQMTYRASNQTYTLTVSLPARPYQVTVNAACGGSATVYM